MHGSIVVDPYNGILCGNKKEYSISTQNIPESQIILQNERRQTKVSPYYMTPFI